MSSAYAPYNLVPLLVRRSEVINPQGEPLRLDAAGQVVSVEHKGLQPDAPEVGWLLAGGQTRVTAVEAETTDDL